MKLQFFFTVDLSKMFSNAIVLFAGGFKKWRQARKRIVDAFSHTGPIFTGPAEQLGVEPDSHGIGRAYYESIAKRDPHTGKTGVRGPYPFSKLADWQAENMKRRALTILDCPGLTEDEIGAALSKARAAVPRIHYAHYQIAQNARGFAAGRGIPLNRRSPNRWTCVEFDMRILPGRVVVPAFSLGDLLYDEFAPWSVSGNGFYQLLMKYAVTQRNEAAFLRLNNKRN